MQYHLPSQLNQIDQYCCSGSPRQPSPLGGSVKVNLRSEIGRFGHFVRVGGALAPFQTDSQLPSQEGTSHFQLQGVVPWKVEGARSIGQLLYRNCREGWWCAHISSSFLAVKLPPRLDVAKGTSLKRNCNPLGP